MPFEHVTRVEHADWSAGGKKRWIARAARLADGRFLAEAPVPVESPGSLLAHLQAEAAAGGCVLCGFDFPIGLPIHYAHLAGVGDFLALLPRLGRHEWADFYLPAHSPEEIHPRRPFYPARPGGALHRHLLERLGADSMDRLRRRCELAHPGRRAASPLFWTLGGQQVGKAAITGWRDLLAPALTAEPPAAVWPFSGQLEDLLRHGRLVLAECYPGEYYHHLGVSFSRPRRGTRSGKRVQEEHRHNAGALRSWAEQNGVALSEALRAGILDGFGPAPGGEDAFDALIGLFGMLNVVLGNRPPGEPEDEEIRRLEGGILGQV